MVDIEKIEKRAVRSFYDDGLFEIALGFVLLLLGGYFFATAVIPKGSGIASELPIVFVLVLVSAGFFVNRILRFLKRRITYSRTGYVALKKKEISPKRRAVAAITGAVLGASLAALYGLSPSIKTFLPALNGLLFGITVFFIANRIGLIRFYVLSAVSAVIGLAVTAAGIGDIKGIGLYYGGFGASVLISGLAALIVYLRRSPKPAVDAPEGPHAH